ncbi:MAG: hypothetical protein HOB37_06140 [Rhodospirillaceae bacterium]|jgi:hypothetical protein|nr:hypothetical protein [Rhodospirillaceae bacterium]MBT5839711.1 hypothetical protein [Rhodospirillaceae bacterium]MBT6608027.1 hypothetical protein [Rhodospirillaceae bacterium]MBT7235562.1 hypothetical protein [Rhodospirillaceae bacterium]
MKLSTLLSIGTAGAILILPALLVAAPPSDWAKIPGKTVTLIYPGQSTYQWARTKAHTKSVRLIKKGRACITCHEDDWESLSKKTVAGSALEPGPIAGKNPLIKLGVQAAHDADYLYFRFHWKTNAAREGRMHNYVRYDGNSWKFYGSHRASSKVRSGKQPPLYEDRLAIMLDDGKVKDFAAQGCWVTCHNGMRDTKGMATKAQVQAHPVLGKGGLKKSDIRKYLPSTRSGSNAPWDKTKSKENIAAIKAAGGFLDLWQWRAARSNPVGMADDGYVLEYRLFDKGKNPFSWNLNRKTMTPKYMFDAAKTGFKGLRAEDIGNAAKAAALVLETNAVPYDAKAGWKKGDILPGRLVSRVKAKGSAADNDFAKGVWKDGAYTVVFRRKLDTGHPSDDKIMKVGGKYTIGLAVHDDNVTTRFHFVSLPLSLGIGVDADIKATEVQ